MIKRLRLSLLICCALLAACTQIATPQVSSLDGLKQGCHADYDGLQCRNLAELYDAGRGVNKDPKEALDLWTLACRLGDEPSCERAKKVHSTQCNTGDPKSCTSLGSIIEETADYRTNPNPPEAIAAYQKACDANDALGCARLALLVAEQDPKRSDDLYEKACRLNDIFACSVVGVAHSVPDSPEGEPQACEHFEKDMDQSLCHASFGIRRVAPDQSVVDDVYIATIFNTACEANDIDGCLYLARMFELNRVSASMPLGDAAKNIGEACKDKGTMCYFSIEETSASAPELLPNKAVTTYERVCDLGDSEGCFSAGLLYADGKGLPQDAPKASKLLSQACDAGHHPACTRLGLLLLAPNESAPNPVEAHAWLAKACPEGPDDIVDDMGCLYLGRMYEYGIGTDKNPSKVKLAADRVCQQSTITDMEDEVFSFHSACFRDAALAYEGGLIGGPNTTKAAFFHEKACQQGHLISCYDLGQLYRSGRGDFSENQAFAKAFLSMACDGAEPLGCRGMSELYLEGLNGDPDPAQAAQMLTKACEYGLIDDRCSAPITPETLAPRETDSPDDNTSEP